MNFTNREFSKSAKSQAAFRLTDRKPTNLGWIKRFVVVCLILGAAVQPCVGADASAVPESISQRCEQLGIHPLADDVGTQFPDFFVATVIDAQILRSLGLFGAKNGDRIKVFQLNPVQWRIKDYTTGQSIFVSFQVPDP